MERNELTRLLSRTIAAGATKALTLCDPQPQVISKSLAYRKYGRSNIDRWLAEGLLILTRNRLDKAALAQIAARSNRITYLPVAER